MTEIQKINDLGIPFAYDFSEEFTEDTLKEYCPHVDYCFLSCNQQGSEDRSRRCCGGFIAMAPKLSWEPAAPKGRLFSTANSFMSAKRPLLQWWIPWAPGDSFTCSFSVAYTDSKKTGSERIREAMDFAAKFAAKSAVQRLCGGRRPTRATWKIYTAMRMDMLTSLM